MRFRTSFLLLVFHYSCYWIIRDVDITYCAAFANFGRHRTHYVDSTRFVTPAEGTAQLSQLPPRRPVVASYSIAGSDPDRPKVNQDACFHVDFLDYVCVGVMDGHGLKGHQLTEYLRDQLPLRIQQLHCGDKISVESLESLETFEKQIHDYGNAKKPISKNWNLESDRTTSLCSDYIAKLLTKAFHLAHVDAMRDKNVPAGRTAGTTCIVALFHRKTRQLSIAHVGDSRAIRVELSSSFASTSIVARSATTETTIEVPQELERIESCDGRYNANGNVFYGPVGIAMTRALGDCVMLRAGILPTPVIEEVVLLPSSSSVLVLATDGIWDVLSNQQVAEILGDFCFGGGSMDEAAKTIAETARKKWKGDLPLDDAKVDDITCVLLSL